MRSHHGMGAVGTRQTTASRRISGVRARRVCRHLAGHCHPASAPTVAVEQQSRLPRCPVPETATADSFRPLPVDGDRQVYRRCIFGDDSAVTDPAERADQVLCVWAHVPPEVAWPLLPVVARPSHCQRCCRRCACRNASGVAPTRRRKNLTKFVGSLKPRSSPIATDVDVLCTSKR